ncbi:alpha/beta fold hydrolase [Streptomyces chartreusis]
MLDRLGVKETLIGGLSMGGQIVMEFQRLFPERVRGIILCDAFPGAETEDGKRERNAVAARLEAEGMGEYADEVLDKMLAPHNITSLPTVTAHVLKMMR